MPDPEISDGILDTGVFDVTILETGISYILDNFAEDPKVTLVRSKTARGRSGRQKAIEDFTDGSCDAQMATATTAKPKANMGFVADIDGNGTPEPWMVVSAGKNFEAASEIKSKWTITRCVNPLIYGSAGKTTADLYTGLSNAKSSAITSITLAAYLPTDLTLTAGTWAAAGLPTGLSIDATTGIISGTPTADATYYVSVTVTATRSYVQNNALVTETHKGRRQFVWTITP